MIRVSLCIKDAHQAGAVRSKLTKAKGLAPLKPLWEASEIVWAADVVLLAAEDIAHIPDSMDFCPAIVLLASPSTDIPSALDQLGRVPFATISPEIEPEQLSQLLEWASRHSHMLLAKEHQQAGRGHATVDVVTLSEDPNLGLSSILGWLRNWQRMPNFYQVLGAMFQRWSGSSRVLILATKGHALQEELEIQYPVREGEADAPWVWSRNEPWIANVERQGGVLQKDASPQVRRWMEALKVRYFMPLRHQDVSLGILGFADRADNTPYTNRDWTLLGNVAVKMSQVLALWNQTKVLAMAAKPIASAPSGPVGDKDAMRKQQLELVGRMAMRSSHELKNCLVSIRTFTQLFPEKYADEQFRVDFYEVVSKEVGRLNGLVEKLLFFAQTVPLKLSEERITELVSESLSVLPPESLKNVQVHKVFSHKQPTMWLDRRQIMAALSQILQNAVQALGNTGKLVVMTEDHPHPDFDGGVLAVRVVDTGRGISLQDPEEPFEPFFSTKARGIGLGLTIAKRIVEEHGGTVRIESTKDKGTELVVCLPRRIPNWGEKSSSQSAAGAQSKS